MKNLLLYLYPITLLLLMCPSSVLQAQNSGIDSLAQRAESLFEDHREEEALELYRRILEKEPDNFDALWRTSFLYSRIGNRLDSEERQRDYFNRGIELAERALEVDSAHTQSHFVMAVAMGRKALISGARDRVAASRDIRKYAEQALELDPENAGAWHLLGVWHLRVANLSWFERAAANTLFGGIPDASNEEAAEHIEKAIDLNDRYILYWYDLARVYRELGRDEDATEACRTALEKPEITPDDGQIKEKCRELM